MTNLAGLDLVKRHLLSWNIEITDSSCQVQQTWGLPSLRCLRQDLAAALQQPQIGTQGCKFDGQKIVLVFLTLLDYWSQFSSLRT